MDNLWAKDNYILRLAAIVKEIREDGYNLKGSYGKDLGYDRANWRNFYYFPTDGPIAKRNKKPAYRYEYVFDRERNCMVEKRIPV